MAAPGYTKPKKQAPKRKTAASKEQQGWNGGLYGMPTPGRSVEIPGTCTTPRCGAVADTMDEADPALSGWTRAGVYGSADPDRVWCSGLCATYGIALAELRVSAPAQADEKPGSADA